MLSRRAGGFRPAHMPAEHQSQPGLRLRVTATAESVLRGGHPWLFADSVREQNREGRAGELAVVYDRRDRFLAIGLFDPDSPIRMRVLHAGKPVAIDGAWWQGRLRAALDRRAGSFDEQTNGYRCIHGESDGWPGLVLDRYADVFVLKIYTAAWLPRLGEIQALLSVELKPGCLVLRLSRNIQAAASLCGLEDGMVLIANRSVREIEGTGSASCARSAEPLLGENPLSSTRRAGARRSGAASPAIQGDADWKGIVTFIETGLRFEADVVRGQKTGFFLDQRENRRRVEMLAAGRDVLNAFSFSGGFSLYAARGGARSVTDLDISGHALDAARRNFALNASDPAVARCPHETEQGDAFAWLAASRAARFDLVILDPPSLARREAEREGAIAAYAKLAEGGIRALRPGGVLVASSCSAHVTDEEFLGAVRGAATGSGRLFQELETTAQPADHPATFPEARYLKSVFLKLGPGVR